MKFLVAIYLLAAALASIACETRGKAATVKAPAVPAPPETAALAKPPAPPPQLSTPQTDIQLPPAQAVSPEALATIQVIEELPTPEPAPVAKPPANRRQQQAPTASTPKPEQPPATTPPATPSPASSEAAASAQPPATATPPPAEEPKSLQPVYSEEEKKRVLTELDHRKNEVDGVLKTINPNRNSAVIDRIDRIHSFFNMAEGAVQRGDYSSVDKLSERALILARELASGR